MRVRYLIAACAIGLFAMDDRAMADTFRCGSSLINESSTVDKIVEKCGVPHSKSSRTEDIRMRLPNGTMRTTGTTTTEEWTYERGTTAPPFVVTIVDGKVKSVNVVRR